MKLLLATGNAHKAAELAHILGDRYEVVAHDPGVEETGDTYEANALLKARAVRDATGALADRRRQRHRGRRARRRPGRAVVALGCR